MMVRSICSHCRSPQELAPHEREWLQTELGAEAASFPVFHGHGCSHCHDTGYRGRMAVYEMVEMTPELVALASADDPGRFTARAQALFAEPESPPVEPASCFLHPVNISAQARARQPNARHPTTENCLIIKRYRKHFASTLAAAVADWHVTTRSTSPGTR